MYKYAIDAFQAPILGVIILCGGDDAMIYNDSANKASQRYHAAKWKRIPLSVPNDEYSAFKAACEARGEKVNTVLRRLMQAYTEENSKV